MAERQAWMGERALMRANIARLRILLRRAEEEIVRLRLKIDELTDG